jgi:putative ABC transport system permease protein
MFGNAIELILHVITIISAIWFAYECVYHPDAIVYALKSVIRRWRITSVVLATILVCTLALLIMGGYFYHSFWGLAESTIRSETGHFQIYKKGYGANSKTKPWEYKIRTINQINNIIRNDPFLHERISVVAPELNFTGLLSNGDISATFLGRAVDPGADRKLSSFGEEVSHGERFIDGDEKLALLGKGLSQTLSANPGSTLSLLTSNSHSGMASTDLEVKGITESFSKDYDDVALKIPLSTAWDMIGDTVADKVLILCDKTSDMDTVLYRIQQLAKKNGGDYEYKTWQELATYYNSVKRLYTNIFHFFSLVILVFSVVFITSILMIMILQRTYEIALLRSFGTPSGAILRNFVAESVIMAFLGTLVAIGISLGLIALFNIFGLQTSPPPGSTRGYTIKLRVLEEPYFILQVWEFIVCAIIVSSIYPAIRGCRAKIVQSLRNG